MGPQSCGPMAVCKSLGRLTPLGPSFKHHIQIMLQLTKTLFLHRLLALASILAVVGLSLASATHVHVSTAHTDVQQECIVCGSGLSQAATASSVPLLATLLFVASLLPALKLLPISLQRHQTIGPRAPPFFSIVK